MKKRIVIIGLIIFTLFTCYFVYYSVSLSSIKKNSKNMESTINEIIETKTYYVFIDINPSFTLLLKNNKIDKISCRNNDCEKIINNINIKDNTLLDGIKSIIKITNEFGFDTSKGISIKSTDYLPSNITNIENVNFEIINKEDEKLLLEKDNETSDQKSDIEIQLDNLKKDKDYGTLYSCNIENNKLSCYLKPDISFNANTITLSEKKIALVLNRFGIKTESAWEAGIIEEPIFKIYIDGVKFVNLTGDSVDTMTYSGKYSCQNDVRFNLKDLDLLNPINIQSKFYTVEYEDFGIPEDQEIPISSSVCGEKWCKKHVELWHYYCNLSTQEFEATTEEQYIMYTPDNKTTKIVSKEEYEDYNTMFDRYNSSIPKCEYRKVTENGETFDVLKKPVNGNICKEGESFLYYNEEVYGE